MSQRRSGIPSLPSWTHKQFPKENPFAATAKKNNLVGKEINKKKRRLEEYLCVSQMTSCVAARPLCCGALLSVSGGEEGSFRLSVYCFCFFFSSSGGCSHGRTGYDLRSGRATFTSDRPLPLALSWNGHERLTWRHASRNRQAVRERGVAGDLARSLIYLWDTPTLVRNSSRAGYVGMAGRFNI